VRLAEAEPVGYGFDLPEIVVAPKAPEKTSVKSGLKLQRKLRKAEE
jgi:hypothetical protein